MTDIAPASTESPRALNPYLVDGPALISFSGGRTSAFLLKHILDAHGGHLPGDIIAVFSNTGKEHPATLDFVQACSEQWKVPIVWLEYDPTGEKQRKFRIVSHITASRNGEPFEALIQERKYLPNPVTRFCTSTLRQINGTGLILMRPVPLICPVDRIVRQPARLAGWPTARSWSSSSFES